MKNVKELILLIAEDDDGHADLIREGLLDSGVSNKMIRFCDGVETWNFFCGKSVNEVYDEDFSYLLLLDISMPKMDGVEVLAKVKADEKLKEIPVIMLTTTDDPREVHNCYKLGCNMYITKPVQFGRFAEILHRMGLFIQIIKV